MEDYHDAFYVERGIDADIAQARGYRFWDEETYNEVMESVYGNLGERTRSIMAFARLVGRQGRGVAFPRHAPTGYPDITAGLRPDKPVKLAPPKRHYHGAPGVPLTAIDIFPQIPQPVLLAYAAHQRGRIKVYFEHEHGGGNEDHHEVWHPSGTAEGVHGHTFYVYETSIMRKHIDQTKNPDSHCGVNPEGIHSHQKRAKYLYTPSRKHEVVWDDEHEHDALKGRMLEYHLTAYHAAGES